VDDVTTRTWAVNASEMDRMLSSSPYRTDRLSESDSGTVLMPATSNADYRVVMIETDRGMPKYYFRSGIDDVVEWTREQLDSYLQREWETHLTERLASGNADDVIVRVMLSMNKRSSKAALRRDAAHRDEALAAIEQEGDQFIENRVLSAPMKYEEIPLEHRDNILKVFQFVVDKHDANGRFVKCKARSVADGSMQKPGTYGESTAPVMTALSCKLLLAMAAARGMKVAEVYGVIPS